MPTENRSSNTEMVIFPRELSDDLAELIANRARVCGGGAHDIWEAICEGFAAPASQLHPEPIAWMVGTAIWWTKEEAERDAAATGLPVVPVGPMVDTAEVERLRTENIRLIEDRARFPDRPDDIGIMIGCHIGNLKNQAKSSEDYAKKWRWKLEAAQRNLSERDALLREGSSMMPLGTKKRADWVLAAEAALSTSAEPETRS